LEIKIKELEEGEIVPILSENNKRIAKNTLILYTRQVLILLVSLYTVRVVLNVLGVEDYGIYNVLGGIVTFFSFLSGTMASATQRFFSFALGQNNLEKLKKTFSVNLIIYIASALIALILLETLGLWFVNTQLQVPPERFEAVKWIYHFSVLTFIATIFTTPFMAIIIAHEDMQIYAYVSIVEALLKLVIVFLLTYLPWDKLELYGMMVFAVSIITTVIYVAICIRKYKECQFHKFYWDKALLLEIVGFTGWTLFGQITTVGRNQAVTILLNQVFNPVVVAARAIATNITRSLSDF
jgi:O-antigen/teichoic acid export membrane protein